MGSVIEDLIQIVKIQETLAKLPNQPTFSTMNVPTRKHRPCAGGANSPWVKSVRRTKKHIVDEANINSAS